MVVVPVDADHGETENVDKQGRQNPVEGSQRGAQRGLHVEGHDRDDHSHYAVTESLDPICLIYTFHRPPPPPGPGLAACGPVRLWARRRASRAV